MGAVAVEIWTHGHVSRSPQPTKALLRHSQRAQEWTRQSIEKALLVKSQTEPRELGEAGHDRDGASSVRSNGAEPETN